MYFHGSGKAKIRVLAGSGSSEDPLLGPRTAGFSWKKGQITGLFHQAQISLTRASQSWPNHLPDSNSQPHTWAMRFQRAALKGHVRLPGPTHHLTVSNCWPPAVTLATPPPYVHIRFSGPTHHLTVSNCAPPAITLATPPPYVLVSTLPAPWTLVPFFLHLTLYPRNLCSSIRTQTNVSSSVNPLPALRISSSCTFS